jgi:hypothetical protein
MATPRDFRIIPREPARRWRLLGVSFVVRLERLQVIRFASCQLLGHLSRRISCAPRWAGGKVPNRTVSAGLGVRILLYAERFHRLAADARSPASYRHSEA